MSYTKCLACDRFFDTEESAAVDNKEYCSCTCEAEDYPRRQSAVFVFTNYALINGRPVPMGHA